MEYERGTIRPSSKIPQPKFSMKDAVPRPRRKISRGRYEALKKMKGTM